MPEIARSVIVSEFHGCNGSSVYRLNNGQTWQQSRYRYEYRYAYRPEARVVEEKGRYLLYVAGLGQPVTVQRAAIVAEGQIVSKFTGFSNEARFTFQNGRTFIPAEYKYRYHYAHRPQAVVVDGINGLELIVDGMDEHLRVRPG